MQNLLNTVIKPDISCNKEQNVREIINEPWYMHADQDVL
jgi:hypothetical protein